MPGIVTPPTAYSTVAQQLYLSYFGRPADPGGLRNFSSQLAEANAPTTLNGINSAMNTNAGLKALIESLGTSDESLALYGSDTIGFISAIYTNVLNRAPDFDGLLFWAGEINAGRLSKPATAIAIADGAMALGGVDAALMQVKTTISSNFTNSLDTPAEVAQYAGLAAAATLRDVMRTILPSTNPDTFDFSFIFIPVRVFDAPISLVGVPAPAMHHLSGAMLFV